MMIPALRWFSLLLAIVASIWAVANLARSRTLQSPRIRATRLRLVGVLLFMAGLISTIVSEMLETNTDYFEIGAFAMGLVLFVVSERIDTKAGL